MTGEPKKLLALVDGSSYVFRAYHALPPLTNSHQEPTGAIFGVTNMLRGLRRDMAPDFLAIAFDAKGKTFRHELYEAYKGTRPPMPDDLAVQLEPLHRLVQAEGWPFFMEQGVEADDVIGTLAVRARDAGMRVVISTADKDFAQLVCDDIHLVNTMTGTTLDPEGVREKFGVTPEQIVDYLTLVGDTSDNVPGVNGVGPKTAAKWLDQYGDLETLMARVNEIKGKAGERLREALPHLPLSRELVTIRTDVALPIAVDELLPRPPDTAVQRDIFARCEFKRWLAELDVEPQVAATQGPGSSPEGDLPPAGAEPEYETITRIDDLESALGEARLAGEFAFDTETTSLDAMQAEIVGFSLAWKPGHAIYVPVAHVGPDCAQQIDRTEALRLLKPLLEDPTIGKGGQNLKYDLNVLGNHDIGLQGIAYDTMLESYVLNSTATRHDMDSLAATYLGRTTISYEEVAGKGAKQIPFDQVPVSSASRYAAEDAEITRALHTELGARLHHDPSLLSVYTEIELPLVPVLARMERSGVLVDARMLKKQSHELAVRMAELEEQAYAIAGTKFNLASPKQLQQILYDELKIPVTHKTPTGQPSTAEAVLQELAHDYPLPQVILDYRQMAKLKSTYTDRLPEQVNPRTGRVHTSYHQAVAATGRLSSTDPNLQNIPVRTAEGRRIRQAFIPPPGKTLVAADYSQIELRIMAHLSGDQSLLNAFAGGEDIHRATAAEVFGATTDTVSADQRRAAKAINFGLIYGMSAFGLARQLDVDRGEAQEYIDRYFARYPGVRQYMDDTRRLAHEQGFVETVFGRRLYLPEINNRNQQRRQAAERTAINAPMQGTAADIIKKAMLRVDSWLAAENNGIQMIMQVHDELVFEVPDPLVETFCPKIQELMSGVVDLKVPLLVDVGTGANWDEAH